MSFVNVTDCSNPLDLVFLVDDSSSISEGDWPRVRTFLQSVARTFTISSQATRIGIVRYATNTDVIYRLTSSQNIFSIEGAIRNMRHAGGSTNLGEALAVTYQQMFVQGRREGAAKV